jgi:hypothetical protein
MTKLDEEIRRLPLNMSVIKETLLTFKENMPSIKLDMITSQQKIIEPFFTNIDFDCNALYITKYGISVSTKLYYGKQYDLYDKHKALNELVKDIILKKTKFHNPPAFRTKKLLKNNWTIYDSYITTIVDNEYEGYCIVCHDTLPALHIKSQCCDCRFHPKCLIKIIEKSMYDKKCIMCKKDCWLENKHITLLKEFQSVNEQDIEIMDRIERADRAENRNEEVEDEEIESEEIETEGLTADDLLPDRLNVRQDDPIEDID